MIEESSTETELTVVEVGGQTESAPIVQEILTPPSPPVNEEGQLGLAFAGEDIRQRIIKLQGIVSSKGRVVEDAIEEASSDVPKFREGSKFVDDVYKGKNLDLAKRNLDHLRRRACDLMDTFERASAALVAIIEAQEEIDDLNQRELGIGPADNDADTNFDDPIPSSITIKDAADALISDETEDDGGPL